MFQVGTGSIPERGGRERRNQSGPGKGAQRSLRRAPLGGAGEEQPAIELQLPTEPTKERGVRTQAVSKHRPLVSPSPRPRPPQLHPTLHSNKEKS